MQLRKKRQGFAALRKRNDDLYRQLRGHVRACIDKYDWGYLHANRSAKPRANDKDTLNYWLDRRISKADKASAKIIGRRMVRQLSLVRLEDHCADQATIYYTSHPTNQWAVILLDIDDKDGSAGDACQVLTFLQTLFPGIYGQTSTFGKGSHGYLIVNYPDMTVTAFRDLMKELEAVLRQSIADHGFKSTFEIKGLPGILTANGTYETCGLMAKFPRLATDEDIEAYLRCPYFMPDQIRAVIEFFSPSIPVSVPISISEERKPKGSEGTVPISISEERRPEGWQEPAARMNTCGWQLTRRLRRPAKAQEILDEYERLNLHTGADTDGNRAKLAEDSAKWCAQHFDPRKQEGFNLDAILPLIQQHVTPEIRTIIRLRNRSSYTDEQLAVVMHCITLSATTMARRADLQFTVPNDSISAMFSRLEIVIEGEADADHRKKFAAMKEALVMAGLAEIVDANWSIGRGKKFGLGINHPRHEEYAAVRSWMEAA